VTQSLEDRKAIVARVVEAVSAGARREVACKCIEMELRTLQRWEMSPGSGDRRAGPIAGPVNKFSAVETSRIRAILTSKEFVDLPPTQIVPTLADRGEYAGSESSFYRILRAENLAAHRGRSSPAKLRHKPKDFTARGPKEVWSWDITYLNASVRGTYFYLYMFLDVFSRKVVGWQVFERESADYAASLFEKICGGEGLDPRGLVLHADNGGPMKGATMLATLQRLGVVKSFSRAAVSDDNPFSEALFRTMKYRPGYPRKPFSNIGEARAWVDGFVDWYNTEHLHSEIGFTTPASRHSGADHKILDLRHELYQKARQSHPERWSGATRNWTRVDSVELNPATREKKPSRSQAKKAA
jgi:transposase InsO family protein